MVRLDYLDRLILGGWQLAAGHGEAPRPAAAKVLEAYYQAGFRVFDCADIYTGVETLLGDFIAAHGLAGELKVHTKFVPDLAALPSLGRDEIERAIDRSRARLGVERLDLVQFHWWDIQIPGYLEALEVLAELQRQGKIAALGLTNFDAAHTEEILAHGIPIAAVQTQYSLLDRRPRWQLAPLAAAHQIPLLCYGSLAGGLLSDRYLGAPPPVAPENRSLVKYLLIADEIGGWPALQELLTALAEIAQAHQSDIASVAGAYCLAQPAVGAIIVGVRNLAHLQAHRALRDTLTLTAAELERLERLRSRYPEVPGEVYALERDRTGRHGRIMKYDLNARNAQPEAS